MNFYVLMAAIGALTALSLYLFLVRRGGYPIGLSVFAYTSSVFGLFAGARLFGIISAELYKANTGEDIVPGIVFYGGLLGFLAVFLILQRAMFKAYSPFLFDCAAVTIPLFHGFGRIGCYLSGCCTGFLGAIPIQLFESAGNFIIFVSLLITHFKHSKKGSLIRVYLISYALLRFFTEFFRNDLTRGFIGVLSFSQVISLLLICFTAGHYLKKL